MEPSLGPRLSPRQVQQERTILVVDDEDMVRDLCAEALTDYRVLRAVSGEEALRCLSQGSVDAVLTDILMDGIDGIELLQRIKDTDPDVAVVMMTGDDDRQLLLQALKHGADDYIDKPLKLYDLSMRLAKVLERGALLRQVRRLKQLDRVHQTFLGLVSHKLRTPVTSIGLILENLAADLEPEGRKTLEMALDQASHLGLLIEDLLYFGEQLADPRPPEPASVAPRVLIAQAIDEVADQAAAKGISLEVVCPASLPAVRVDQRHIGFALKALLDNAVKFSDEGSVVAIEAVPGKGMMEVRLRDRGVGIDGDELDKVFDRFYQVDAAETGQVPGFGLGLYYARELVQAQRGTLELLSYPGEGTTARVFLPVDAA